MRQTIAFQATGFECSPVQVEIEEGAEEIDEAVLPVALLAFESGSNLVLTLPLAANDAESMMNAFTQAEPHRQDVPGAGEWEPMGAGISEGMFWALQPNIVGMAVTPPQQTPDGLVPHWTLAFDDEDGSQVQIAVSDPMCVQIVRTLAQVAHGELEAPETNEE
jgi:hypothetical protein